MIIMTTQKQCEGETLQGFILVACVTAGILAIMCVVIYFCFARVCSEKEKSVFAVLSVMPNAGFVGLPIIQAVYGDLGVLYLSTFNESVIGHAISDANLSFNLLFTAQPHVFVSDKHPLASRTEVTVEDLEDYPRYAFEQGANNSFFYSEEPLAELPHKKCISVSDRGTLSNLLAHHDGYTISTGVLSSEMYTGIASVPLQTKELMRVGYIVHNERQLSPLAQSYIEKLSLFVEGYQIGLAGL